MSSLRMPCSIEVGFTVESVQSWDRVCRTATTALDDLIKRHVFLEATRRVGRGFPLLLSSHLILTSGTAGCAVCDFGF